MKLRVPVALLLGLVLVAVVGGIVWLVTSLDGIVKRQIEQHGTRLAGTAVTVDGVDIDLTAGSGRIRGLRIANPEGFSDAPAIALQEIGLAIDLSSLAGEPLRIERIDVGAVDVRLELDERGRSNVDVLRRHAREASPQATAGEAGSESDEALRLAIGRLEFAGGRIVSQGVHTRGEQRSAEFPGLSLRGLGGAGGASPGEIGQQVLVAFTGRVVRSVAEQQASDALGQAAGEAAGKVAEGLRGLFE
jgi:uncharacterized protein involved in outer membrane biogenesis